MRGSDFRLVIAIPDFRKLWLVGLILSAGRWLEMLATSVYVYQHTRSAFLVSVVIVARFVPMSLFGAIIGTLAERIERRTLLILMNLGLLICAAALALLAQAGMLEVWHLVVASFFSGIVFAADFPVRRVMLGEIVGSDRMVVALSIDSTTSHGTRTFGPFIGGALLAADGIGSVFLLQAVSYGIAMALAMLIGHRARTHRRGDESILRGLREGWVICRDDPRLVGIMWLTVIFNVFCFPYVGMVPVIGSDILHLDAAQIGLLGSMDGLGSLLGALSIALVLKQPHYQRVFVGSTVAALVAVMLFAFFGNPFFSGASLVVLGFAIAGFAVMQSTLIYLLSPSHARARIMGLLSMAIGFSPIGIFLIGILADTIGPSHATATMSLTGLALILVSRRYWGSLVSRGA